MIHTKKEFESCFEELKNRPVISQKKASDCGKDLNQGDCGCKKTEIDPRLSALAELLKE